MSTNYHFVNREKKTQVEQLKKLLETEREGLLQRLEKFGEENPLAMGNIEDVIFALRPAMTSANVQSWDDDMEIGVASSTKFYWAANNGFGSLFRYKRHLASLRMAPKLPRMAISPELTPYPG